MWQCGMCHLMFLLQQTGWTSIFVGLSVYNLRNFWSCCCWKGPFHRENCIKPRMKIYEFFRYTFQLQEFFQMFSPILTFKRGFGELLGPTCQIKVNRVGVTGMFPTGFSLGQRGWILGWNHGLFVTVLSVSDFHDLGHCLSQPGATSGLTWNIPVSWGCWINVICTPNNSPHLLQLMTL